MWTVLQRTAENLLIGNNDLKISFRVCCRYNDNIACLFTVVVCDRRHISERWEQWRSLAR